MTSTKKRLITFLIIVAYAFSLVAGVTYFAYNGIIGAFAAQTENNNYKYYYDNLVTADKDGNDVEYVLAKRFYLALESIYASGDFKKGVVDYSLDDILTSDQIKAWVIDGNLDIPRAFGAARDSFLVDHPELFYVDMYKLTISAGRTNGVYSAYIDCGREADCYRDPAVNTEAKVNAEIVKFNSKVDEIVAAAKAEADKQPSAVKRDYALAIAANEALGARVEYDFDEYNNYMENEGDVSATPMTYSSYGALVNGKAVCSGFAQAYKVIMDRLEIPCIIVSGFCKGQTKDGEDTAEDVAHAWNYVYLEAGTSEETQTRRARASEVKGGEWFAFDTTWNSLNKNKNRYSAMNAIVFSQKHIPHGVISSSNYCLSYPALSILNYEQALNPSNFDFTVSEAGFVYEAKYTDEHTVTEKISYNGKPLNQIPEGYRVIFRWYYKDTYGDGTDKWTKWMDFKVNEQYLKEAFETEVVHTDTYTIFPNMGMSQKKYTQYAIVKDIVGDEDLVVSSAIKYKGYYYNNIEQVEENAVFESQLYYNTAYGSYTPAPYLSTTKTKPYFGADIIIADWMSENGDSNKVADKHAILISLVYNEPLHVLDDTKDIVVNCTPTKSNTMQYAGFAPFDDGKLVHLVADSKGVYNTLQFKFKPSLMYEHNREAYIFTFENVGSAKIVERLNDKGDLETVTSDKLPNYAHYVFGREAICCPKCFGDGRLWIDCCAQPTLVDNSDLSAMDFKDEEGNSTFTESARSQMMLVVNNVTEETKDTMLDEISGDSSINVDKDEIKASQTYDIKLQICGKYSTIPDRSYVKIALGFPEGYGPDDEGVTFKLFHRKHVGGDEYVIEEVPCVVTKFGIVATVTSFSPYMVAVVPAEKATNKTVYASIDGKGGKLTLEDGKIQTVDKGGSYTYTLTPDAGYKLYKVTLNGQDVTSRVSNGKLTVNYAELTANNEVEIQYISDAAAERYSDKKIEMVEPVKVLVSTDKDNTASNNYTYVGGEVFDSNTTTTPQGVISAGLIVGLVIGAFVLVGAAVAAVIVIKRKKSSDDE